MFALGVVTAFISSHCWITNPMKNLSHTVKILFKMVAVALTSGETPKKMYNVDMVISGNPASKGTPSGMDFTATTIEHVTIIMLQRIGEPKDKNTRYVTARLKSHEKTYKDSDVKRVFGACPYSFIEV